MDLTYFHETRESAVQAAHVQTQAAALHADACFAIRHRMLPPLRSLHARAAKNVRLAASVGEILERARQLAEQHECFSADAQDHYERLVELYNISPKELEAIASRADGE